MPETAKIFKLIRRFSSGIRNYADGIHTEDLLTVLILAGTVICILSLFLGILNKQTRRKWLSVSLLGFVVALISFVLFPLPEKPSVPASVTAPTYELPTRPRYQIEQRQKIYWELVQAEDRAHIDSMKKYPLNPHKLDQYRNKLKEFYKKQVRDKYVITKEDAGRIQNEGETKNWPKP
ncbi:MAG: hypothetical protein JSU92_09680 [Deltaproteobacteria bacterium]|nr:MAG: hypothetical protein JSU92_09680 [Deltaproteobacteria bacterium]